MEYNLNIFSIDLEDWYHSYYSGQPIKTKEFRIVDPTEKILKLLKQTNNHATFFVVGEIAQRHPQLIKEIAKQGHEIACHSLHHQFIYNMTEKQFEKDLLETKEILESLIHKKVVGYRAPAWSVSKEKTPWFWKTLNKHQFKYSSSVFPFKTFLYGDNKANRFYSKINDLPEIPPSTDKLFSKRIPFSGGFYLRLLPFPAIKFFTKKINDQKKPVIFYIHPREIDPDQPKYNLSLKEKFIHYYNVDKTFSKLEKLLHTYSVVSIKKYYHF